MLFFVVCVVILFWSDVHVDPAMEIVKESTNKICRDGCCLNTYEYFTFECDDKEDDFSAPVAQWQSGVLTRLWPEVRSFLGAPAMNDFTKGFLIGVLFMFDAVVIALILV